MADPLAQTSIQSYMFYQLKFFDPSLSDAAISAQAGFLISAKTAGQREESSLIHRARELLRLLSRLRPVTKFRRSDCMAGAWRIDEQQCRTDAMCCCGAQPREKIPSKGSSSASTVCQRRKSSRSTNRRYSQLQRKRCLKSTLSLPRPQPMRCSCVHGCRLWRLLRPQRNARKYPALSRDAMA